MEKLSVGIHLGKPINFGFSFPRFFFPLKGRVVISKEFTLQVVKKGSMGLVLGSLDTIQSGKNSVKLFENVAKDSGVPIPNLFLEMGNSGKKRVEAIK